MAVRATLDRYVGCSEPQRARQSGINQRAVHDNMVRDHSAYLNPDPKKLMHRFGGLPSLTDLRGCSCANDRNPASYPRRACTDAVSRYAMDNCYNSPEKVARARRRCKIRDALMRLSRTAEGCQDDSDHLNGGSASTTVESHHYPDSNITDGRVHNKK